MKLLFWLSAGALCYIYAGYPLIAAACGALVRRAVAARDCEPDVTLVIAARNEEAVLGATLRNKLALDYPAARLQIIVVSDGSTDRTDAIVSEMGDPRILLLRQSERRGKTAALNLAVRHASGEVIVFCDANSIYAADALRKLVRNFSDPSVGYVTGRLVYGTERRSATARGCRLLMAYEHRLRIQESRLGSIVGVNGGIDAMRLALYAPMRDDQLPDLVLPLRVVREGSRVVYEPEAVLREFALGSARAEYAMRVRVALRALWALFDSRALLLPRRGWFAWQLWSHKVLRYFAFTMLPVLYLAALETPGVLYRASFAGMTLLLLLGVAGWLLQGRGRSGWATTVPFYFLLVNAAAAHAASRFARGQRQAIWVPRLG